MLRRRRPQKAPDNTCTSYFLVHHRSRLTSGTQLVCEAAPEDTDTADAFELPGRDLSGEELTVRVIPKQADEFRWYL